MKNKELIHSNIKKHIKSLGYILISTEYINNTSKLIIKDLDGYYYLATYANLCSNHVPAKVHKSNPYTIQNIQLWTELNKKTFKIVSDQEFTGSNDNLKWECFKCTEIFKATWSNISKISENRGCSICSGHQVGLSNCLETLNPVLASEWHPIKNGDLTPFDVTCGSGKLVWWQCDKNTKHEWEAYIYNRNDGDGCPYCSGHRPSEDYNLLVINPILCKEWHPTKNDKNPNEYCPSSHEFVWWKCDQGHEWYAVISSRSGVKGNNCPYCAGQLPTDDNNLLVDNPYLCEEWYYEKNDKKPEEYCPNSNQEVWWKCKKGHEWEAIISNRNSKESGCPYCAGQLPSKEYNLFTRDPILASEWHTIKNGDLTPYDVTVGSNKFVWWICKECNHEWYAMINCRSGEKGSGCPECNKTSTGEILISNVLNSYNISNTSQFKIEKCRNKNRLPFDHAIFGDIEKSNLIFLIEYDGPHHFYPVCFGGMSEESAIEAFKQTQINDKIRNNYCLNNNIPLLRIPYWEFDNISTILITELQKYNLLPCDFLYYSDTYMNKLLPENSISTPYIN